MQSGDRLDLIAQARVGDATQFWHVADANTALDGRTLVETRGRHAQRAEVADMGDAALPRLVRQPRRRATTSCARIEEIEVTQEMDAFWEARLRMAMCLDAERRAGSTGPATSAAPFSRVRVELDIGDGSFAPLIDGPLVSVDAALDSQPGRSTATMVVRDDSAFLHRDEEVERLPRTQRDSEIADELFRPLRADRRHPHRPATKAARPNDDAARHGARVPARAGCGERPPCLRAAGRRSRARASAAFLPDPTDAASLPPLVLIGDDRNLANASITRGPGWRRSARTRSVLRVNDQGVVTFETSAADLGLMRDLPAVPADLTPRRLLHPADNTREDPDARGQRAGARSAGYVYTLTSQVVPGCYAGVLSPYNKVRVDAGATPYSGDYLITKVVHRITPSLYSQRARSEDRLGDRGFGRAGRRGARRRPVDLGLGQRGDLLMTDFVEHTWNASSTGSARRYYGKYRGIVTDVDDPDNRCRIRARVPACSMATPSRLGDAGVAVRRRRPRLRACCRRSAPACGSSSRPAGSTSRSGPAAGGPSGQRPDPQGPKRARHRLRRTGHKVILDDDANEVKIVHSGGPEITISDSEIVMNGRRAARSKIGISDISLNNGLIKVGLAGVSLVNGAMAFGVPP